MHGLHLIEDMTGTNSYSAEFLLKSLLAGGVAGMCSKTTVAPLDRAKILLQAHNKHYKHLGIFSVLKTIVQKESVIALYKGNGAQMVRIFPYAATQFTSFEVYKQFLCRTLGPKSHIAKFLSGSLAGVTAVTLTYPLDMVRARLAFQVSGEHRYTGIVHTVTSIFKQEGGLRALYRGYTPTIMGMIPYAGLSFYCFESLKYFCLAFLPNICAKHHAQNTGGLALTLPSKLLCGGFAGCIAQSVAYPLDVARRRMQLSMMIPGMERFSKHWLTTLVLIFKEDGIVKGLYRGMTVNYLRVVPMVAVSFSANELMKQVLHLDTGMTL